MISDSSSRVAQLIELDRPPLNEPGPTLAIDRQLLTDRGACNEYGMRLLELLAGPSGSISGRWSTALALWVAGREPAAADWVRAELGLGVAGRMANLDGVRLPRASLRSAHLEGASLQGAYLWQANLEGADLERANLTNAVLEGAYLWRSNLDGARLERASLNQAHLGGAYLRGAKVNDAVLWKAELEGAHLERADFAGTNLFEANLSGAWREAGDPPIDGWHLVNGRLQRSA